MLEKIMLPEDLKKLSMDELKTLAAEIRNVLIAKASKCGGHLASNLGAVELTIAIHYVFESPNDRVIFDVSHQCYTHKILTGRKKAFMEEGEYGSVTGFTNPAESVHDWFNVGHTSTAISLACGLAKAGSLRGRCGNVIAVVGDAALDGGQAFEALNYGSELEGGLIVAVNDNGMSIPENHGALSRHLKALKEGNGRVGNNFFESLGYEYLFVKDGHDIESLISAFGRARSVGKPVVVHCCTVKGKGYAFAEENPEKWHHAHPFDISRGAFHKASTVPKENYGGIVGDYLEKKLGENPMVVALTASVPACFGFHPQRRRSAGKQYVDVGISEQNMIALATAMARGGARPVVITESSFYQRAYDQIQQELCRNNLPITMLIAFSGIYAHNDDTHIGFFDIQLFANVPNLIYLAPTNKEEYLAMLEWSIERSVQPVAIRIPWNGVHHVREAVPEDYGETRYWIRKKGSKVALLGLGSFFQLAEEVCDLLEKQHGIYPTLVDPMFATGYDKTTLEALKTGHSIIVTLEDGIVSGGFGARIAQYYSNSDVRVMNCGFSMDIPTKFSVDEMMEKNGLKAQQIVERIIGIPTLTEA